MVILLSRTDAPKRRTLFPAARALSVRPFRRAAPWVVLLAVLLAGTAPAAAGEILHEVHADLKTTLPASPRLGLVKPVISIFQVSAGGVNEKVQDWCDAACENLRQAIEERFGGDLKIISIEDLAAGPNADREEELLELQGLFDVVTATMAGTWAGQVPFPKEYRRFDYSLGDATELFEALEVDALIFMTGQDQVKTGGRKAFEFVSFLAGVVYFKSAYLEAGLVGPSGKLLWYKLISSLPKTDLREAEGARAYADAVFAGFPLE